MNHSNSSYSIASFLGNADLISTDKIIPTK
jgi:lipopolysaccharide export LptBFGC system permease protein LptF